MRKSWGKVEEWNLIVFCNKSLKFRQSNLRSVGFPLVTLRSALCTGGLAEKATCLLLALLVSSSDGHAGMLTLARSQTFAFQTVLTKHDRYHEA